MLTQDLTIQKNIKKLFIFKNLKEILLYQTQKEKKENIKLEYQTMNL